MALEFNRDQIIASELDNLGVVYTCMNSRQIVTGLGMLGEFCIRVNCN